MGIVMPIGGRGQMIYIPDGNDGPSGPWTNGDTKIAIALCIVFFVVSLLSIIIEWQFAKRTTTLRDYLNEVLTCGTSYSSSYSASMFTNLMVILFYIVFGLFLVVAGVYGLTTIM
jgi:ABC-type phosphate/phosphonate transport system permease subunit